MAEIENAEGPGSPQKGYTVGASTEIAQTPGRSPKKDGKVMKSRVINLTLENYEKSRASKVYGINHEVPETWLNMLRTDKER